MSDFVPEPEETRELKKAMPPQRDLSSVALRTRLRTRSVVIDHLAAAKREETRQPASSATGAGERVSASPAVDSRQAAEPEPESGTGTGDTPALRPEKGSEEPDQAAEPARAQQPNVISSDALTRAEVVVMTAEDSSSAELEKVCGPVVSDVLRASLEMELLDFAIPLARTPRSPFG